MSDLTLPALRRTDPRRWRDLDGSSSLDTGSGPATVVVRFGGYGPAKGSRRIRRTSWAVEGGPAPATAAGQREPAHIWYQWWNAVRWRCSGGRPGQGHRLAAGDT